ncbi:MAG: phage tail sheath C-terminal domain-containing protein, partial [Limisphaerales bacterium]
MASSILNAPLGAPGLYRDPGVPLRALTGVRMDVAAFVGVAPRGPAREQVLDPILRNCRPDPRVLRQLRRTVPYAVESFDEYRRLYGGFGGPGLLPYAVAAFFDNGGRRAYIARVVHDYPTAAENEARVAEGIAGGAMTSAGPLALRARNEGSWGNALRVGLTFTAKPLIPIDVTTTGITVAAGEALVIGALLRLTFDDGSRIHRVVTTVRRVTSATSASGVLTGTFETPIPAVPEAVEILEGDFRIDDGDGRVEVHTGQGLSSLHPRWLAATLCYESQLVRPGDSWIDASIEPDPTAPGEPFCGGEDDYPAITPEDFFDPTWSPAEDEPGDGITALAGLPDLSILVVPDLYSPQSIVGETPLEDPVVPDNPGFVRCGPVAAPPSATGPAVADLDGLRLDPELPQDLAEIERLQSGLVGFASELQSFIVLLDVPPRLHSRQVLAWRAKFDSAYAAAYHPWLLESPGDDDRDALIAVPPSAVAAGIIARKEWNHGVAHGPANELALAVVDATEPIPPAWHDVLHPQGINVFLREPDGIRLTAARTLSRDAAWRQISVRRLVTLIRRTIERRMQWLVFEPNNRALRAEVRRLLTGFLRRLFQGGAFAGATEEESFFVR